MKRIEMREERFVFSVSTYSSMLDWMEILFVRRTGGGMKERWSFGYPLMHAIFN